MNKLKQENSYDRNQTIVALAGGVGAAKLLAGFYRSMNTKRLHIIVNTGDDSNFFGLHISPDIDILTYTLAGIIEPVKHWGIKNDTFRILDSISRFYGSQWFNLGDQDLATSIYRTDLMYQGLQMDEICSKITHHFALNTNIYPMCNQPVPTMVETDQGLMNFQEYFVKNHWKPRVLKVFHQNVNNAKLNPKFLELFQQADKIIICPSNPILSINPILQVPKMRTLLQKYRNKCYAISPLVQGMALKGPTREIFESFHLETSCKGVAKYYQDIIGNFIIDVKDQNFHSSIEGLDMKCSITNTIMDSETNKDNLAQFILRL